MSESINLVHIQSKYEHEAGYEFLFQRGSDFVVIPWKTPYRKTPEEVAVALRGFEQEAKSCFDGTAWVIEIVINGQLSRVAEMFTNQQDAEERAAAIRDNDYNTAIEQVRVIHIDRKEK